MRCQRSCGRKAAPGHRICSQCHERTVIRMADGVSRVYSKPAPWQRIVGKAKQAAVVSALVEKANKKP